MSNNPHRISGVFDRPLHLRLVAESDQRTTAVLIDEAQLAERQGRHSEARSLYEQALGRLRDPQDALMAATLLRWIGLTYQIEANPDAAFDCFEASLAVAAANGEEGAMGHTINAQAATYYKQGQLDEAERLYMKARESARRAGDAKLAAITSQNLGIIANIRGELEQALWHYEASLAEYRALGLTKYICMTLNNLGMLYTRMERWETAERAYDEAVEISNVLGDLTMQILLEVNLSAMWISRQEFPRAREASERALELSRKTQDTQAIGEIHKCFGIIARETGDFVFAEQSFLRAQREAEDRQDMLLLAEVARDMAELYRRQGRNRDTLQCLNRAHRLFTQLHARPDVADIDRQTTQLESDFLDVVRRWGESIESKDHYTQGHCERVANIACALAESAGLDPKALFWFRIGALLHDVGKLMIPPEVLNKPGRLTAEEWALVKQHPVAGVQMLADIDFPWDVRPIVESHHERWDGGGYPHGTKGEAIPFTARILCIADVYDALTSERSYKKPVAHDQAMEIMRGEVGGQFDPSLFPHFETVMVRRSSLIRHVEEDADLPPPLPAPDQQKDLDDLTGVPLRRAFIDHANAVLARRRPNETTPALLVIDVDHFKLVNDTYGHLQGDDVLRAVVAVLRSHLRNGDVIGRYGGDEFVVLLPRTPLESAAEVAERLRVAVDQDSVMLRGKGGASISVTLSIGVAAAQPDDHVEAVFAAADRALYDAKRAGRNAVAVSGGAADAQKPQLNLNRFVGRVEEMRRLVRLLDASQKGEPRVLAIVGEAGVGKSTLVRQLLPEVRLRSGALVIGRCVEADVKPPYGPWAEIIAAIRPRVAAPERTWRELPRLVPSLAEPGAAPPTTETAGSKYALYDEIVEYVRMAAASCPVVIVLDDMQWADSATWDTLEHLVPQLEHDRVMICLTIRAEDKSPDIMDRRRRLSRDERFAELSLQRLTREELEQWLAAASHGQELGRELLPVLYRHTEGNPFLVVQVLRALIEEGEIRYESDRWKWRQTSELRLPVAVSDLMARRLDRLSPETRAILTTAAVIGRMFDIDLAIEAGAGTEDQLLDAIDEAVTAAVLEPSRGDSDKFSFAHTLLIDAIRSTANPRRLRRIHKSVADAMERKLPAAVAEIASHYDVAQEHEKAFAYAIRAGTAARGVYAHDEAAGFFTMAQRNATTDEQKLDATLGLAYVAELSGRYADANALCEEALATASAYAGPSVVMPIRRMRERLRELMGQPLSETLEACQALLAEVEAAELETERVALLTMISRTYSRLGDLPAALRLARACVERAQELDDKRLMAESLTRLGGALWESGSIEAIDFYKRAEGIWQELGDRYEVVRITGNMGVVYSSNGDVAAARDAYTKAMQLGLDAHAPDLVGVASVNLGLLLQRAGEYDQAQESFEDARRLFVMVKNEPHRLGTLYNMGILASERGDDRRALELFEETAALARRIGIKDVEIGAVSGAGLSGLSLELQEYARGAAGKVEELIGDRSSTWFQGRELAEVLAVRLALADGRTEDAEQRFRDAMVLAEQRDPYAAAWLVANTAPLLAGAGFEAVWSLVEHYAARVDALGYLPLAARYTALMKARLAEQVEGDDAA